MTMRLLHTSLTFAALAVLAKSADAGHAAPAPDTLPEPDAPAETVEEELERTGEFSQDDNDTARAAPLLPGDWDTTLDEIARNASTPDAHDAVAALANGVTDKTTLDELCDQMHDLAAVATCPDVRIQLAAQAARFKG